MSEIATKVKAIIVDKLGVDEKDVKETAHFANDLGADSLDTVELIMELEKEFGITIPEDADPTRLASAIFATTTEGQLPTSTALEFLKQEMREL